MKVPPKHLLSCAIVIAAILLVSACNSGDGKKSKTDPQNPAATAEVTDTPGEGFTGMGGADTGLPSERPGIANEEGGPDIDLYYIAYTIKKGDMVSKIAADHGISQDAIISLNKLRNTRSLQVGQVLKLPSINGIIYTVKKGDTPGGIADKYKISLEKVALVNNITDNIVPAGSVLFLPDAKLDWVTLQEINGDLFRKPIHGGYYISSRYGWRNNPFSNARTFHNGIDMATSRGSPVFAALDGTVIDTGYDVTYGNYVIVSHHSGYQTMYGHLNTILTARGKRVTTATKIGLVGNTGQSTGPHLHFTVFKYRSTLNPASLWN
jgi:murein DD-endopeptidase MepM/ murein hydrolase activator NlpD